MFIAYMMNEQIRKKRTRKQRKTFFLFAKCFQCANSMGIIWKLIKNIPIVITTVASLFLSLGNLLDARVFFAVVYVSNQLNNASDKNVRHEACIGTLVFRKID